MPAKRYIPIEVLQLGYRNLGSIHKVAAEVGISASTVKRRLVEAGVALEGPKTIDPDRPSKTCNVCKTDKPVAEYHRCKSRKDGRAATCKVCWVGVNRDSQLKLKYGITAAEYDELLAAQDSRCAICGLPETNGRHANMKLAVDHCHTTNTIRGLLCSDCNNGLGRFKDDPELLLRAAAYLKGD